MSKKKTSKLILGLSLAATTPLLVGCAAKDDKEAKKDHKINLDIATEKLVELKNHENKANLSQIIKDLELKIDKNRSIFENDSLLLIQQKGSELLSAAANAEIQKNEANIKTNKILLELNNEIDDIIKISESIKNEQLLSVSKSKLDELINQSTLAKDKKIKLLDLELTNIKNKIIEIKKESAIEINKVNEIKVITKNQLLEKSKEIDSYLKTLKKSEYEQIKEKLKANFDNFNANEKLNLDSKSKLELDELLVKLSNNLKEAKLEQIQKDIEIIANNKTKLQLAKNAIEILANSLTSTDLEITSLKSKLNLALANAQNIINLKNEDQYITELEKLKTLKSESELKYNEFLAKLNSAKEEHAKKLASSNHFLNTLISSENADLYNQLVIDLRNDVNQNNNITNNDPISEIDAKSSKLEASLTKFSSLKNEIDNKQALQLEIEKLKAILVLITSNDKEMVDLKDEINTNLEQSKNIIDSQTKDQYLLEKQKLVEYQIQVNTKIDEFKAKLNLAKANHAEKLLLANQVLSNLNNENSDSKYDQLINSLTEKINENNVFDNNDPINDIKLKTNNLNEAINNSNLLKAEIDNKKSLELQINKLKEFTKSISFNDAEMTSLKERLNESIQNSENIINNELKEDYVLEKQRLIDLQTNANEVINQFLEKLQLAKTEHSEKLNNASELVNSLSSDANASNYNEVIESLRSTINANNNIDANEAISSIKQKINNLNIAIENSKLSKKDIDNKQALQLEIEKLKAILALITSNDKEMTDLKDDINANLEQAKNIIDSQTKDQYLLEKQKLVEYQIQVNAKIEQFKAKLNLAKADHAEKLLLANQVLSNLNNENSNSNYDELITNLSEKINSNNTFDNNDPINDIKLKTNNLNEAINNSNLAKTNILNKILLQLQINNLKAFADLITSNDSEMTSLKSELNKKIEYAKNIISSENKNEYTNEKEKLVQAQNEANTTIQSFNIKLEQAKNQHNQKLLMANQLLNNLERDENSALYTQIIEKLRETITSNQEIDDNQSIANINLKTTSLNEAIEEANSSKEDADNKKSLQLEINKLKTIVSSISSHDIEMTTLKEEINNANGYAENIIQLNNHEQYVSELEKLRNLNTKANASIQDFSVKLEQAKAKHAQKLTEANQLINILNSDVNSSLYAELLNDINQVIEDNKDITNDDAISEIETKTNKVAASINKNALLKEEIDNKKAIELQISNLSKISASITSNDLEMQSLKDKVDDKIAYSQNIIAQENKSEYRSILENLNSLKTESETKIAEFLERLEQAKNAYFAKLQSANEKLASLTNDINSVNYVGLLSKLSQGINENNAITNDDAISLINSKTTNLNSAIDMANNSKAEVDNNTNRLLSLLNEAIEQSEELKSLMLPEPELNEQRSKLSQAIETSKLVYNHEPKRMENSSINQSAESLKSTKGEVQNSYDEMVNIKNGLKNNIALKDAEIEEFLLTIATQEYNEIREDILVVFDNYRENDKPIINDKTKLQLENLLSILTQKLEENKQAKAEIDKVKYDTADYTVVNERIYIKRERIDRTIFDLINQDENIDKQSIKSLYSDITTEIYAGDIQNDDWYANDLWTMPNLEYVYLKNVKIIPNRAFYKTARNLKRVNFPNATAINRDAFRNLRNLSIVNLPKVKTIGTSAFLYNTSLVNIDLPEVISIDTWAFQNANKLQRINVPNLENLDEGVFEGASSLISINIENISAIKNNAFKGASSLQSIIATNATSVGSSAFEGATSLSEIELPNVLTLGASSFKGTTSLTNVQMPNVISVGSSSFEGSTKLTSLNLPNATSIGSSAFKNATKLREVNIPNVTQLGIEVFKNASSLTNIDIPLITEISSEAFKGATSLTSINAPNVLNIYGYAFENASSLTSINFPKVVKIYESAFKNARSLTSINLPEVRTIEDNAFEGAKLLENVNIEKVEYIGNSAFRNASSLSNINLPNAIRIGEATFSNNLKLSTVSAPLLTLIPRSAFYSNSSLTSIFIPKVSRIESLAFIEASSLNSIELPEVTAIENWVFKDAVNLSSVTAPKLKMIGNEAFKNTNIPNGYVIGEVTVTK